MSVELSLELLYLFEPFCFHSCKKGWPKILLNKSLISVLSAWFWGKVIEDGRADVAGISCPYVGSISMMYEPCMGFVWEPLRTDFGKEPSLF